MAKATLGFTPLMYTGVDVVKVHTIELGEGTLNRQGTGRIAASFACKNCGCKRYMFCGCKEATRGSKSSKRKANRTNKLSDVQKAVG